MMTTLAACDSTQESGEDSESVEPTSVEASLQSETPSESPFDMSIETPTQMQTEMLTNEDIANSTTVPSALAASSDSTSMSVVSAATDVRFQSEQLNDDGSVQNIKQLQQALLTPPEFIDDAVVPADGWICTDSTGVLRTYYFFDSGVLDVNRAVIVERTLAVNESFSDLQFFWNIESPDSITLVTAQAGLALDSGQLISTGRRYDINTIRFSIVGDQLTFTAESLLRGRMVCALFALSDS